MQDIQTTANQRKANWRYRAPLLGYVLLANVGALALALSARKKPYYALDLKISRAVQSFHAPWFDRLMNFMCGLGYPNQVNVLGVLLIFALYRVGLRWEALSTLFATIGSAMQSLVLLLWVNRPRPASHLVRIRHTLPTTSFPSGHVLIFTAVVGFLWYLVYKSRLPGILRLPLLAALGGIVVLMGPARIHSGEHWASDVLAGYLVGSSWLALSVRFYYWGRIHLWKRRGG
jgi:undecaprenyl-diphosphatase